MLTRTEAVVASPSRRPVHRRVRLLTRPRIVVASRDASPDRTHRPGEEQPQALQQHYDDVAQITLWYPSQLEAFRSDRFTGFTTQPTDGGVIGNQSGYWGFLSAEPAAEADTGDSGGGLSAIAWVGIGIAVLAGAIGIPLALRRRKAEDRA
ncbi:hypothetical protein [Brevibacterium luteolum]|uniref:hypothetical protein n=1 Tax=Brevibacterium luteolum TaxID=199591 RepID=UPI00195802C5|nr:hypothetical protein [Brevibacterium luteolum]MBM7529293.1 hypothetical protein [Brevibacterium luteolum]